MTKPTQAQVERANAMFATWRDRWAETGPGIISRLVGAKELAKLLAAERVLALEEAAGIVPTNWCDALLTGPSAVSLKNCDCHEVEALLRSVAAAIRRAAEGEKP